jgi:hypothetical protein
MDPNPDMFVNENGMTHIELLYTEQFGAERAGELLHSAMVKEIEKQFEMKCVRFLITLRTQCPTAFNALVEQSKNW